MTRAERHGDSLACNALAKQVGVRRAFQGLAANVGWFEAIATDQNGGHGGTLFHQQAGGRSEFVGYGNDGVMQFAALEVFLSALIIEWVKTGNTEREFDQGRHATAGQMCR